MDKELKKTMTATANDLCRMLLEDVNITSEQYTEGMKNLQIITAKLAEFERIENEAYEAEQKRSQEFECKDYEFDLKQKQQLIDIAKIGIGLLMAVGGGVLKIADMTLRHNEIKRITYYEKENNILGVADKAIAQKVPPRDW